MNKTKMSHILLDVIVLIITFQLLRELLEYFINPMFSETFFSKKMVTMCVMIILTFVIIFYSKLRSESLSVFPMKFTKKYIIATVIVSILYISTPSNYTEGFTAIMSLIYGSIVTPIYEELLFRGYIWNRLKKVFKKELYVFLFSVIFFTIWHLGYMIPQILVGNWMVITTKIAAGFGYGVVLGLTRLKTQNCYSTILLHGTLNLFMI